MANLSNINDKFLVTTGGNVLIGATADVATVRLHVKNASAAAILRLTGGSDSWDFDTYYTDNKLFIKSNGAAGTVMTLLGADGNVGIGEIGPTRKLDIKATSNSQNTVLAYNNSASFTGTVYEAITDRVANSAFNLMNLKSSTSVSKFLVRGDGNVGIGTATPACILNIEDSVASTSPATDANNLLLIENTNVAGSCNIRLRGGDGATRIMYGHNVTGDDKLYITPRANDNPVIFDGSGNVEVSGNITIHDSSNAPYIDFVESGATSDSKARITMDQVDTNNGQLIFSTENAGTLTTALTINQTQDATFAGNVGIADNKKLTFGAAPDFEIYHNSTTNVNHISSLLSRQLSITADTSIFTGDVEANNFIILDGTSNYIQFDLNGKNSHFTSQSKSYIWSGQGASGDYLAGTLNFQSRSSLDRDINFITGATPAIRLTISGSGDATFAGDVTIGDSFKTGSSGSYMGVLGFNRNITSGAMYNGSYGGYQLQNYQGALELQVYTSVGGLVGIHTFSNNGDISFFNKVGIGTTSPDEILHLYNASAGDTALKIETTSGGDPTIYMTSQAASRQGVISFQDNDINAGRIIYEHATDIMTFYTGGTGASHLELTLQETAGAVFRTKVGIGTGDPYSILEVTAPTTKTNLGTVSNQTITCSGGGGVGEYNQIGFGYTAGDYSPAVIGYVTTDGGVSTKGDLVFATRDSTTASAPTERMRVLANGDVRIGNNLTDISARSAALQVSGNEPFVIYGYGNGYGIGVYMRPNASSSGTHTAFTFRNESDIQVGSITTTSSATAFNVSSDYRLKENVVEMTSALDRVSQLKPSRFNFIADANKTVDGFLAHEVSNIVPEAITGEKDAVDENGNPSYQGIDQSKLVPLLVGAIQELKAEIDILKNK